MTSLSQRLGGRLPSPPLPAIELSPASTRQARHHVEERFSGIPEHAPAALDLEVTRGVIERALANRAPLAGIGRRHLRLAPWVMLATADGRPPLVERADFLQAYRDYLQTTTDGPVIVNLVLALLSHYPTHLPSFSALLTLAASLLERCSRPRCRRLQRCAARHSLLAPEGHRRFWNHLARATTPIDEFLRESCLGGILSTGRFVEGTLRTALADTMRQLRAGELEPAQLERALAFALDGAGKRLRFAGATRITVADALLLPFREANHANPHQPRIQEFLLEQFSDPRINRAPWHGVNEEAVAVMRRWMVSETLEDFFRLLEYTSQEDPTARRHWHYRKAFWSAYLRAGVINDACTGASTATTCSGTTLRCCCASATWSSRTGVTTASFGSGTWRAPSGNSRLRCTRSATRGKPSAASPISRVPTAVPKTGPGSRSLPSTSVTTPAFVSTYGS